MKRRFFATFLLMSACLVWFAGEASAAYLVGLTHGTNKQRPEASFTPENMYQIGAARNEWEPFQVLIRSSEALVNVDVQITAFEGPGADIETVEPYRVAYVPVEATQISHQPPDPNTAGLWPDGLVPFVDHFVGETRAGAPFDVAADFTQGVFVDVYVPEDQAPGDYTAEVTVTADGHAAWNGTVTLTVWNFTLPNSMSLDSNYQFSRNTACNWHSSHGGVTDCETLVQRYFQEFARHRMGLYSWRNGDPVATWNDAQQTFDMDWTAFDAYHAPYLNGTFYKPGFAFTGIRLPGAPGGRPDTVDPEVWEREYWAGWAAHFRAMGWLDKLWYYMPDEPTPSQYANLAALAARLHAADPDLHPMVTEQYEEDLGEDIDIWCPDEPFFSDSMPWPPFPEVYDDLRADGARTWWYNCVSANTVADFAAHMVDYESTYMRIWLWLTRRYHFQGILFWATNYLTGRGQDIWESQWTPPFACQGDGTLVYPGTIDHIGGTTDIPVASLRMKYLRESMEDYEYFHLLDENGDEGWVDAVTLHVAPKSYQWEHDWDALLEWRRRVAEKILGTLDETPPAAPTGLAAEARVEAVALTWTLPADPDVVGYDIWYGIYDGDAFFGGTIEAPAAGALVSGLTPGREHSFWVVAFDAEENRSAASAIVTATPLAAGDDDDDDVDDDDSDENRNAVGVTPLDPDEGDDDDDAAPEAASSTDNAAPGCGGGR